MGYLTIGAISLFHPVLWKFWEKLQHPRLANQPFTQNFQSNEKQLDNYNQDSSMHKVESYNLH